MKFVNTASALLAGFNLLQTVAAAKCTTTWGSVSVSVKRYTVTIRTTTTKISTKVITNIATTTQPGPTVTTTAPAVTSLIDLPPDYYYYMLPLASASKARVLPPHKRSPEAQNSAPAPAPPRYPTKPLTRFPQEVACTTILTIPRQTIAVSTLKSITTALEPTVTLTAPGPTSTIFSRCAMDSENVLQSLNGKSIGSFAAKETTEYCPGGGTRGVSGPFSGWDADACESPVTCCETVVNEGLFSGWRWSAGKCTAYRYSPVEGYFGGYVLYEGENDGSTWYGNGLGQGGTWGSSGVA